jgi:uncharacterized membrane protein
MKAYNKNNNYIGSSKKQKEYTKHLYKKCSALNYTSFVHDFLYGVLLYREINIVNRIIMKMLFDLIFLIVGIFRSIFTLQFNSIVFIVLGYIILLISTFYFPVWNKKNN